MTTRRYGTSGRLWFFGIALVLAQAPVFFVSAQPGPSVEVKVFPSQDGQTTVQITVPPVSAASAISLDLPPLRKPTATPTRSPGKPIAAAPRPTSRTLVAALKPAAPTPGGAVAFGVGPAARPTPTPRPLPPAAAGPIPPSGATKRVASQPRSSETPKPPVHVAVVATPVPVAAKAMPRAGAGTRFAPAATPSAPSRVVAQVSATGAQSGANKAAQAAGGIQHRFNFSAMVQPIPTSVASSVTLAMSQAAPTSLTLLAALPDAAAPNPAGLSAAQGAAASPAAGAAGGAAASPAATGAESAADQVLRKRFREIQAKVLRGRNDEAGREFLKLASDFPLSAIAPEALYEAAQLEKADIKVRLAGFSAIVDQYPSTPWAVHSLCEIGRTQFLLADYAAALDAFRAYQSRQGEEAQKPQLRVSIVYCLLQLRRYEEALDELDRLEVDFPQYRSAEKVLDLKSECQMALARYDEAIFSLRALLRGYPNYALVPKALLSLGLCYEQTNRPDEARPVYVQLIQMYPPDRPDTPFETKMAAERIAQLDRPLLPQ